MSEAGIPVKNSGFPSSYFRIRAAGTVHYIHVHRHETDRDGNALTLWNLDRNKDSFVFFINPWGALCCKHGGIAIDVTNNTLVIAHNRPATVPWPNPWSHYLPTFSYSTETQMITVEFHSDPVLSVNWPRPESEWKDKEFVLAARSSIAMKICGFAEIARWSPGAHLAPLWTTHGGVQWQSNSWNNRGSQNGRFCGDSMSVLKPKQHSELKSFDDQNRLITRLYLGYTLTTPV